MKTSTLQRNNNRQLSAFIQCDKNKTKRIDDDQQVLVFRLYHKADL